MTSIRRMDRRDIPVITDIYAHYAVETVATFDEKPLTAGQWRDKANALDERGLPFLVAEADGDVAGYAYAAPYRPKPAYRYTVEDSIYLAPGHTGRGLGRGLLEALIEACERTEARQMIAVIAATGGHASIALHRACGFAEVGRLTRVGFKHGRWIDTRLMQRNLDGTG